MENVLALTGRDLDQREAGQLSSGRSPLTQVGVKRLFKMKDLMQYCRICDCAFFQAALSAPVAAATPCVAPTT